MQKSKKDPMVLVVVLWGEKTLDFWQKYSAPSYFAPGNVQTLAQSFDLTFHFASDALSIQQFQQSDLYKKFCLLGSVKFSVIDKAIAVTKGVGPRITFAYYYVIRSYKSQSEFPYFVFLNSDFILANNCLTTLTTVIKAGHRLIMGPTLRFNTTHMDRFVKIFQLHSTQTASLPNRKLVQFVLDHLHTTVLYQTINDHLCEHSGNNQLHWRVNDSLMLARNYLQSILCFRPLIIPDKIQGYFDYTFAHEFTPGITPYILNNSDTFFMAEAEDCYKEYFFMNYCIRSFIRVAERLSKWTNPLHRLNAETIICFQGEKKANGLEKALEEFNTSYEIIKNLCSEPLDYAGHPYWPIQTTDILNELDIPAYATNDPELQQVISETIAVNLELQQDISEAPNRQCKKSKNFFSKIKHRFFKTRKAVEIDSSIHQFRKDVEALEQKLVSRITSQLNKYRYLRKYNFISINNCKLIDDIKSFFDQKSRRRIDAYTIDAWRSQSINRLPNSVLLFGDHGSYNLYFQDFISESKGNECVLQCLNEQHTDYHQLKQLIQSLLTLVSMRSMLKFGNLGVPDLFTQDLLQKKLKEMNYIPEVLCLLSPIEKQQLTEIESYGSFSGSMHNQKVISQ